MEHNTDRLSWTVFRVALFIAAIGIFLSGVGIAIANGNKTYQKYETGSASSSMVQHHDTNSNSPSNDTVDSSPNSDFSYSDPNTADNTISITKYSGNDEDLTIPKYRKIGSVSYKVTAIESAAFNENKNIKRVTIPDSVTSIGAGAFLDTELTSINIPDGVTSIAPWAFADTQLTSITIPDSVTSIGMNALGGTRLTSVDIPDSVTSIGDGAFCEDTNLNHLTLGSGITSIDSRAFIDDTALTTVDFPASLKSIGDYAFHNTSMSAISFKKPVNLSSSAFSSTKLTNITLPTGSTYHTDANNQTFDANVKVTFN